MVSGVKNLNECVLDFVLSLWSDHTEFMALFMVWSRFYFSALQLIFNFSVAISLLLPLD